MVLLIDGMYLVFSSFYAHINMRTFKGSHTGALYGFINKVEGLIKELNPAQLAVAFDSREKTFRHELYPAYKAGRDEPPQELLQQLDPIFEYLKIRGIHMIRVPGFEADDIIAQIARREQDQQKAVIFSADKDLFQLVGGNIALYHPKYNQILDMEGIRDKFGLPPEKVIDYLSLVGDNSDNIPGVKGIGPKSATRLLQEYGSLEGILAQLTKLTPSLRKKIAENLDHLQLSRKLIDLNHTPGIDPRKLKVGPFHNRFDDRLSDFFTRYSFNRFLQRFKNEIPREDQNLGIRYHLVTRVQELSALKEKILEHRFFALDLETDGLEFNRHRIAGLSISFPAEGYYLPFVYPKDGPTIDFTFQDFKDILSGVFADPQIDKVGHNLKFDLLFLKFQGIPVEGQIHDTMIMSYLINPKRQNHKLKSLTLELLNYRQTAYEELSDPDQKEAEFDKLDLETVSRYCIDDSHLTLRLKDRFQKILKEKNLLSLYTDLETPLIPVLLNMEFTGIGVDSKAVENARSKVEKRIQDVEKEIWVQAGYPFNINSSQQVGELLFEKMQLPVLKKTQKTGSYATDNRTLQDLAEYQVVNQILLYRRFKKLLSTYLIPLQKMKDAHQRIHTQFNQTITATGRLSSSHPNLQNIPVETFHGINIRQCFVAGKDRKLFSADYSQIELRVLAHFSRDPRLIEAFQENRDIHQHTADIVFGDHTKLSPAERRKRAKIINFSIIYGSGPYSLSRQLGISFQEAKEFIDHYFDTYSRVKDFIDRTCEETQAKGYVQTLLGRRREVPEIRSDNKTVRENGKRIAVNTIIQGSAADIIKKAMIEIHNAIHGWKTKLILQVHDELIFEYPTGEENALFAVVKKGMEETVTLNVPLLVDTAKGPNWGELQ